MRPYTIGRGELITWINQTLGVRLTCIEQAFNGAYACHLVNASKPGLINIHKVDQSACGEFRCLKNYKLLQAAFNTMHINKTFDILQLAKAKPVANLEFLQWLKAYLDGITLKQPPDLAQQVHVKVKKPGAAKLTNISQLCSTKRTNTSRMNVMKKPLQKRKSRVSKSAKTSFDTLRNQMLVEQLTKEDKELRSRQSALALERRMYMSKLHCIETICNLRICTAPTPALFLECGKGILW